MNPGEKDPYEDLERLEIFSRGDGDDIKSGKIPVKARIAKTWRCDWDMKLAGFIKKLFGGNKWHSPKN